MGRIGDGDVHQAYVEFRAKDTDKVSFRFPLSTSLSVSVSSPSLSFHCPRP